ncbi:hypothetical protein [Nocardiopsis halotolerans]|uniref:hypothetical protein n=1 Tax=Nocardiopsis halotolerans TaxID=124252 RepID=UPI00034D5942|nr:hypothetical protein [Nocardiopsis halotolerans]
MSWNPSHDQARYDTAQALTRRHAPRWLILWSPSNRAYYAFHRGHTAVAPLREATPRQLTGEIQRVERRIAHDRHNRHP